MENVKADLCNAFEMKDNGKEQQYVGAILKKFGMIKCAKPALTTTEAKVSDTPVSCVCCELYESVQQQLQCRALGRQRKRILRYLSGTKKLGLLSKQTGEDLFGVVDADWGANLGDGRSYSGQAFILSGAALCVLGATQATCCGTIGTESVTLRCPKRAHKTDFGITAAKNIDVRHHFIKQKYLSGDIE
ncbi:uncharacterized protein LOC122322545, partial [Drosophila grimshawi]|uniref:uncharacterized protein LOC122322545 n=1 Tax=Drosophila grimshawi TaxID=7222 RepID=UPI001C9344B0